MYFIWGGRFDICELVQCFILQSASEGCDLVRSHKLNKVNPWMETLEEHPRATWSNISSLNHSSYPRVISIAGVQLRVWGALLIVIIVTIVITIQNMFRGGPYYLWSLKNSEFLPHKNKTICIGILHRWQAVLYLRKSCQQFHLDSVFLSFCLPGTMTSCYRFYFSQTLVNNHCYERTKLLIIQQTPAASRECRRELQGLDIPLSLAPKDFEFWTQLSTTHITLWALSPGPECIKVRRTCSQTYTLAYLKNCWCIQCLGPLHRLLVFPRF